ncbi:MAG: class II fructose-bisphosphate aldolase [Gallionellaceae bacterium]|nr:class II fructose-bisphosphate aldolase [Gallionellaceae bacterium]
MPLVNMKHLITHAYRNGYAVGAFDVVSLAFLQAIVAAAETARAPVILSLAETRFEEFDFELLMPAVEAAARRASVPVAIQLDHGANLESAVHAIRLGCNGVMLDASHDSFFDNVERTRAVVEMARACGVAVEGELGYVPGVAGESPAGALSYTTLAEAKGYVERTGVDFLAVSIGTVHGHLKDKPRLDWGRLKEINTALGIPLVIHGGSGLSDEQSRKLITLGIAKINYATALADIAGERIRAAAKAGAKSHAALLAEVRGAVSAEVERCLRVWGSAGRAAEVQAQCQPWLNVEHVVVYNAPTLDEGRLRALMAEGQRQLATIPGVREVVVGSVADKSARYRHCWLIRFASAAVIDSFKRHPVQASFIDRQFNAAVADRLGADYCIADQRTGAATLPLSSAPILTSRDVSV